VRQGWAHKQQEPQYDRTITRQNHFFQHNKLHDQAKPNQPFATSLPNIIPLPELLLKEIVPSLMILSRK
jgi:hypothetical protein